MIWLVLILFLVVLALSIALYAIATRRAVKSLGTPTPEEARIKSEDEEITKKIRVTAQRDKETIANEDKPTLLTGLRDLVRRK